MVACWAVPCSVGSEGDPGQRRLYSCLGGINEVESHTSGFQPWHKDLAQQPGNGGIRRRQRRS